MLCRRQLLGCGLLCGSPARMNAGAASSTAYDVALPHPVARGVEASVDIGGLRAPRARVEASRIDPQPQLGSNAGVSRPDNAEGPARLAV